MITIGGGLFPLGATMCIIIDHTLKVDEILFEMLKVLKPLASGQVLEMY